MLTHEKEMHTKGENEEIKEFKESGEIADKDSTCASKEDENKAKVTTENPIVSDAMCIGKKQQEYQKEIKDETDISTKDDFGKESAKEIFGGNEEMANDKSASNDISVGTKSNTSGEKSNNHEEKDEGCLNERSEVVEISLDKISESEGMSICPKEELIHENNENVNCEENGEMHEELTSEKREPACEMDEEKLMNKQIDDTQNSQPISAETLKSASCTFVSDDLCEPHETAVEKLKEKKKKKKKRRCRSTIQNMPGQAKSDYALNRNSLSSLTVSTVVESSDSNVSFCGSGLKESECIQSTEEGLHVLRKAKSAPPQTDGMMLSAQRKNVMDEIISSESRYVRSLQIASQFYDTHLSGFARELGKTFSSISTIIKCAEPVGAFFTAILDLQEDTVISENLCLGLKSLMMYIPYVCTYSGCIDSITTLMTTSKKFAELAREFKTKYGDTIESYLIMPIQRIPRYVLLFKELLKAVPESFASYKALNSVYSLFIEISDTLNEKKREKEQSDAMKKISNCVLDSTFLQGSKASTHVFVKGGFAQLGVLDHPAAELCCLFLFDDVLVFTRCGKMKLADLQQKIKQKSSDECFEKFITKKRKSMLQCIAELSLQNCDIRQVGNIMQNMQNAFQLYQRGGPRYTILCLSRDEKIHWEIAIDNSIQTQFAKMCPGEPLKVGCDQQVALFESCVSFNSSKCYGVLFKEVFVIFASVADAMLGKEPLVSIHLHSVSSINGFVSNASLKGSSFIAIETDGSVVKLGLERERELFTLMHKIRSQIAVVKGFSEYVFENEAELIAGHQLEQPIANVILLGMGKSRDQPGKGSHFATSRLSRLLVSTLLERECNKHCCSCGLTSSVILPSLGIFICGNCRKYIDRLLERQRTEQKKCKDDHRILSISSDYTLTQEEMLTLAAVGNDKASVILDEPCTDLEMIELSTSSTDVLGKGRDHHKLLNIISALNLSSKHCSDDWSFIEPHYLRSWKERQEAKCDKDEESVISQGNSSQDAAVEDKVAAHDEAKPLKHKKVSYHCKLSKEEELVDAVISFSKNHLYFGKGSKEVLLLLIFSLFEINIYIIYFTVFTLIHYSALFGCRHALWH